MTQMKYFAFGTGETNGTKQSPEDCLMFYAAKAYAFNDANCRIKYHGGYICEIQNM